MVILDTNIWIWWVNGETKRLTKAQRSRIRREQRSTSVDSGLGVSVISCWEVASLYASDDIELRGTLEEWIHRALDEPGIRLVEFTLDIAIASMRLPGHLGTNDPKDKAIVATARLHPCPLITSDGPLRDYPHVETI